FIGAKRLVLRSSQFWQAPSRPPLLPHELTFDPYLHAGSAFSRRRTERLPIDLLALHPGVPRLRERRMADAGLEGVRIFPDRLIFDLVVQPSARKFDKEAHVLRHAGIEFDVSQLPKLLQSETIWRNPVLRMIQARAHQRVHPNEVHRMGV